MEKATYADLAKEIDSSKLSPDQDLPGKIVSALLKQFVAKLTDVSHSK